MSTKTSSSTPNAMMKALALAGLGTLLACGGGGGGGSSAPAPTPTATSLAYTDPTSGTLQLKKNTGLSTSTHLVLDVVGSSAGTGAGVAFTLSADSAKATWVKVASGDAELVQNGAVLNLGSGTQAIKAKKTGGTLQAVVSQKGTGGSVALNGVLARVALDLVSGQAPGTVTLSATSNKTQLLLSNGTTPATTLSVGTLTAQ